MLSGVYAIVCIPTGKKYVGSSVHIPRRLCEHHTALRKGRHHSPALQRAWAKYGESNFEWVVEAIVAAVREDLLAMEQAALDIVFLTKKHLNGSPTAGSPLGIKWTVEARARMSALKKGRRMSPEAYEKLLQRPPPSEEARKKTAQSLRGHKHTEEAKRHMKQARSRRRPATEEAKRRMSAAHRGVALPESAREKLRKFMHGKNKGQDNPNAKLGLAQVEEIRSWYDSGQWTMQMLADKFKVSIGLVHGIIHKTRWTTT